MLKEGVQTYVVVEQRQHQEKCTCTIEDKYTKINYFTQESYQTKNLQQSEERNKAKICELTNGRTPT